MLNLKKVFGLVECDLEVPDSLKYMFSELPPIFKNVNISRTDLSAHMSEFAKLHGMLKRPQKSLIGSFFEKKILLLTPLLKWYLDHGLMVTKVYQIVQYKPLRCFEQFGNSVVQARRMGDANPSKAIIAETAKLSGNVMYGTTITNKERFTDIKYVSSVEKATQLANSDRFIFCNELTDDLFEVQLKLDTPIVIGFSILQYAKLRMLEFYYDFVLKYIDRLDNSN